MIERIAHTELKVVCVTRKVFECGKNLVYNHNRYLTHFYYKIGDRPMVGICLR